MSSLPVEITHVSAVVKETSHKISVPPCIPSAGEQQGTSHAPFSFLVSQSSRTCPRGCVLDPRSLRLAQSSLRLRGRSCAAQLARACCKLERNITTAWLRHAGCQHGCAAQAALAHSSLAEDGAQRCSCRPADPPRLLTADQAAAGRVQGNSAIHRR